MRARLLTLAVRGAQLRRPSFAFEAARVRARMCN